MIRKAPGRPHVVLAQIHNADDDVATIRMEGTTVVSTYGDSGRPGTLATGVADGTIHEYMIKTVRSGSSTVIQFFWDDMTSPKATQSYGGGGGCYFKFGNYHQSTTSDDDQGDSFVVDLYDSEIWHTGYPAPTARNGTTAPPRRRPRPRPGGGGTVPVGASTRFTETFELGNFSRWNSRADPLLRRQRVRVRRQLGLQPADRQRGHRPHVGAAHRGPRRGHRRGIPRTRRAVQLREELERQRRRRDLVRVRRPVRRPVMVAVVVELG